MNLKSSITVQYLRAKAANWTLGAILWRDKALDISTIKRMIFRKYKNCGGVAVPFSNRGSSIPPAAQELHV